MFRKKDRFDHCEVAEVELDLGDCESATSFVYFQQDSLSDYLSIRGITIHLGREFDDGGDDGYNGIDVLHMIKPERLEEIREQVREQELEKVNSYRARAGDLDFS